MVQLGLDMAYLTILLQFGAAMAFILFTYAVIAFVTPKRHSENKDSSFECGIEVKGNARQPFSVKYFLVAILFVLFDVEVIFLYPWAVNFKKLGWFGFAEMILFIAFFLFGFYYVVRRGALNWD